MNHTDKWRLVILATHPIQHFVPLYRALQKEEALDLLVLYGSRIGLNSYFDREMNTRLSWAMDLTSGYTHAFLPEADRIKSSSFFALNNPSVARVLDKERPDALIVYGYSNLTVLRAILWASARHVPLLMISDSEVVHRRSSLKAAVKQVLLRLLAKRVGAFLTVGDNNESYWKCYGVPPEKMFRTPFTIDEDTYISARAQKEKIRDQWRQLHGIAQDEIVFLTVGKVSSRKRQKDLIDALVLARQISDAAMRVVIAGDGFERRSIQMEVERLHLPVTMLGFVNVDELPKVYAACDVLVHTSARDPHPLVMSEAAAMGLPVIASDQVGAIGPTDILREGENALVFPVGDVAALAEKMVELGASAEKRNAMSHSSLRIFSSQDSDATKSGLFAALRFLFRCHNEDNRVGAEGL